MVLKCQEDSFLKNYSSSVVSCEEGTVTTLVDGKETTLNGYKVILEDTILFPEGGGQPSDHGFLNDNKVYHVTRVGSKAVHFVDKPLTIGENVTQVVNWERRFDHMQQHSGQHLITAIIDRDFGFPTISWYLGEQVSYIELDTPSISPEQVDKAENVINELIRADKKVTVQVLQSAEELKDVRARGLPEDHEGDVRVITIEDVESNMCCGTHVSRLSQLQVVKLLNSEKSKRKNKTLLYFLVGNRVLKRLSACLDREQQLTVLLKNNSSEHPSLVEKLQKNLKTSTKDLQIVLKDLAAFEVQKFKNISPAPKYYVLHRKEAEPDFMNIFIKEVTPTDTFLFLSVGDDKGAGNIVLYGSESVIGDLSDKIVELLQGKGMGKGNRFQAKIKLPRVPPRPAEQPATLPRRARRSRASYLHHVPEQRAAPRGRPERRPGCTPPPSSTYPASRKIYLNPLCQNNIMISILLCSVY